LALANEIISDFALLKWCFYAKNLAMQNHFNKVRIIARLDIKGPNVVKTVHTEGLRVVGNPAEMLDKYYEAGADEIIYMDIVASLYQRSFDFDQLKKASQNIFIPMTVGGGIRSLEDIEKALHYGADKVAINTYAVERPEFLVEAVKKFGSQCIVLSVEAKDIGEGKWEAYTNGGREKTGMDIVNWIKRAIDFGVGEILLTSIDKDGTRSGYAVNLIKNITSFSPIPVIAHGGAGKTVDILEVIKNGQAEAVSISSILHYQIVSIKGIKSDLLKVGIYSRKI
jgi:imidazole glycerol-phosphate synthase subunit HisF